MPLTLSCRLQDPGPFRAHRSPETREASFAGTAPPSLAWRPLPWHRPWRLIPGPGLRARGSSVRSPPRPALPGRRAAGPWASRGRRHGLWKRAGGSAGAERWGRQGPQHGLRLNNSPSPRLGRGAPSTTRSSSTGESGSAAMDNSSLARTAELAPGVLRGRGPPAPPGPPAHLWTRRSPPARPPPGCGSHIPAQPL